MDVSAQETAEVEDLTERQRLILHRVEGEGFVTIEGLAVELHVSAQTIRRDIIALAEQGLVQRFHGGAGRAGEGDVVRLGHHKKRSIAVNAKRAIAVAAAERVRAGDYVYVDVGTTAEAAAQALVEHADLTVFTNSMRVATCFNPAITDVHVLGGQVRGADGSIVGEGAVDRLHALRLDVALIACSGIEPGGAVMDFDPQKIAVKRAAMASARESYLLATRDKFGRTARECIARTDAFCAILSEPDSADEKPILSWA